MNKIIEEVFDKGEPYRCPKCNKKLECYFHERDSTSNYMRCPKCHWQASTDWDAEWNCTD